MTFRTRLNLRRNWPLWGAVILFLVAILYFLILAASRRGTTIYPLIINGQEKVIYLSGFALIFLLIVAVWALRAIEDDRFIKVGVAPLALSALVGGTNPPAGIFASIPVFFLGVLIMIVVFSIQQAPIRAIAVIFSLVAMFCWLISIVGVIFSDVHHRDSVLYKGHMYQVAQIEDLYYDCKNFKFVVYQCDSLGFVCHPRFTSHHYRSCFGYSNIPLQTQVSLAIDPASNELYLQLDDKRFPVEPQSIFPLTSFSQSRIDSAPILCTQCPKFARKLVWCGVPDCDDAPL